jgi:hypothetical protein
MTCNTGNKGFQPCFQVDLLRLVAQNVLKQVLDLAADVKMRVVRRVVQAAAALLAVAVVAALPFLLLLILILLLIVKVPPWKISSRISLKPVGETHHHLH